MASGPSGTMPSSVKPGSWPLAMLSRWSSFSWSRVKRRLGQQAQHRGLEAGDAPGHRHQDPLAVDLGQQQLHQLLEAVDAGAGELIGLAGGGEGRVLRAVEDGHGRIGDIADIDRLEAGLAAADQRQEGREARHLGEAVEEIVLGPEDDAGAQDDGLGELLAHHRLALGLGPGIEGGGGGIGAQGRDMQQALHPGGLGGGRDPARALGMDGGEALRPMLDRARPPD